MDIFKNFEMEMEKRFASSPIIFSKKKKEYFLNYSSSFAQKNIYLEISPRTKSSFSIGINTNISHQLVEETHALINKRFNKKSIISLRLSFLIKAMNLAEDNFERVKFNGVYGNIYSLETSDMYFENLENCLNKIIIPFFDKFENFESLNDWINKPILEGTYDFETKPIWKDAINGLIIAKLSSNEFEKLYDILISKKLPKTTLFDTRADLKKLHKILSNKA